MGFVLISIYLENFDAIANKNWEKQEGFKEKEIQDQNPENEEIKESGVRYCFMNCFRNLDCIIKGIIRKIFNLVVKHLELNSNKPNAKRKSKTSANPALKNKIKAGVISIGSGGFISELTKKPDNAERKEEEDKNANNILLTNGNKLKKREVKEINKNTTNTTNTVKDKKSDTVKNVIAPRPIVRKTNIKSDLSVHVVTRWYRSPEIILLEKDYGAPIDIWSIGWIFAELLTMLKENATNQMERKPLFPGSSWFPLSPSARNKDSGVAKEDQLWVIINKLGTPSEEDTSFITDPGAQSYLKNLPRAEKKNFKDLYPFPGDEAIDLLDKLLQFNPYKRASLMECLEHPLLADVRDQRKELNAKTPIVLDFDYEDVNRDILRQLFVEEILFFRGFYKRAPRHGGMISNVEAKSMANSQTLS